MAIIDDTNGSEDVTPKSNRLRNVLIVVVALVVCGSVGWWRWTRTPQYALRQIASAYRQHDLSKFQDYVDTERVAGSFVDQTMQFFTQQNDGEDESALGTGIAQGIIMMMRPALLKMFTDGITKAVETGTAVADDKQDKRLVELQKSFFMPKPDESGYRGVKYVHEQGKIATAGLEIYDKDYEKSFILDVKLRDVGSHWQVVELSNIGDFMRTMQRNEKELIAKLNAPIKEKMNHALRFDRASLTTTSDSWGISKAVNVHTSFTNIGNRRVTGYEASLTILDATGKKVRTFSITSDHSVSPGAEDQGHWGKDVNMFMPGDQKMYDAANAGAKVTSELERLKFDDGTELAPITSRQEASSPPKHVGG